MFHSKAILVLHNIVPHFLFYHFLTYYSIPTSISSKPLRKFKKKIVNFHTQTNILQLSNLVACADASSGCDVKCKFSNIHTGYCNKSSVCCSRMRMCFFMIKIVYGVCLIQTLGVVDEREQQNLIKSSDIYL